jgi:CRP-like cAMP-binding protein
MGARIVSAGELIVAGSLPFLKRLQPAQRRSLAECAMEAGFVAGELIFREGDVANRFYFIRQGSVALESEQDDAEPTRIQTLGPNDLLGWSWLFAPYRWHFTARALESVSAIFFYGTRLREQCEAEPELGYALVTSMAKVMMSRLQATRRQLLGLSALALRSQSEALQLVRQMETPSRSGQKQFRPNRKSFRTKNPHVYKP